MEDNSSKRNATTDTKKENDDVKKCRGTFFGVELEREIDSLKRELFAQTHEPFQAALKENSDIFRLIKETINSYMQTFYESGEEEQEFIFNLDVEGLDEMNKPSSEESEEGLEDYPEKIKFFMEFGRILNRVKPNCDFIDANLLIPIQQTLRKIREACGCDLSNVDTWSIAQPYTSKLCELAQDFETRKYQLSKKRDYFFDEMQLFIMIYQSAKEEDKSNFLSKLREHPQRMVWTQPWLRIAEGKEVSYEGALMEAQQTLPEQPISIGKQGVIHH